MIALFICQTHFDFCTVCTQYRLRRVQIHRDVKHGLALFVQAGHLQHFAKPSAAGTITHPLSNGTPSHESQLLRVGGYMS